MPLSPHAKADLVLILVTMLAAAGWVFSRETLHGMPPMLFIGVRFLLAASLLLLYSRKHWHLLRQPALLRKMFFVGCFMAAALLCWVMGLAQGTHMGEGAFITSLGIVLVPVSGWLLFRDNAPLTTWLALPVAVAGLGFLSLKPDVGFNVGQLYYLSAAILFSVHFALVSRIAGRIPTTLLTGAQLFVVGMTALLVSLLTETWPASISGEVLIWFLLSAVVATGFRFGLQTYAQGLAPASHVALIMILEPIWTTLAGMMIYGEVMTLQQVTGCVLILLAMIVARWRWVRSLLIQRPSA